MHVGIIPDGNRRWAKKRRSSLLQAYAIGFCNVISTVLYLQHEQCDTVTFFGLSYDNYKKRPSDQIDMIFSHVIDSMLVSSDLLRRNGICVRFFGKLNELTECQKNGLKKIEKATKITKCKMNLNILVNYRADWDVANTEGFVNTSCILECDIVFRSGHIPRLSGFMPLHITHAMLHFSHKLWPDVRTVEFQNVINKWRLLRQNFGA